LADATVADGRVVVGSLVDRSVRSNVARERAVELAFQEMNEAGGVGETKFGVLFCSVSGESEFDELSREEAAVASALYLAEIGVPALIGPMTSNDTETVFSALGPASDVLVMSPSATSPSLVSLEAQPTDQAPGLLWRTAAPDSRQGRAMAFDLNQRGVSSVAVIYDDGVYATSVTEEFRTHFSGTAALYRYESDNYATVTVGAAGTAIEEIVFVSDDPSRVAGWLALAAQQDSVASGAISLFLTEGAAVRGVLSEAGSVLAQVRGARPAPADSADPVFGAFRAAYTKMFADDPRSHEYVANAYDAAWLIGFAASRALLSSKRVSGVSLARGLRQLSDGVRVTPDAAGWLGGLTALGAGHSVNYHGASGSLDYNNADEEPRASVELWTVSTLNPNDPQVVRDYDWSDDQLP